MAALENLTDALRIIGGERLILRSLQVRPAWWYLVSPLMTSILSFHCHCIARLLNVIVSLS